MQLNEIHNPHEHGSASLKVLLLTFSLLLIGALGYLTWDYLNTVGNDDADYFIAINESSIIDEKKSESSECAEPTPLEKTYTSTKQGFCFNYLKAWTLTNESDLENNIAWRVSLTDKIVPDSDYPGQFHIYRYSKVSNLPDYSKNNSTSLNDYIKKYSSIDEPAYKNITATTIDSVSGFKADAGDNSFGGGQYYFFQLSDGTITMIWVVSDNDNTKKILESFNFLGGSE